MCSSILVSINSWALPDCGNEGCFVFIYPSLLDPDTVTMYNTVILFKSQPRDVEVFEEVHSVADFPCDYEGEHLRQAHLQWIINSTVYDLQLPPDHLYLRSIRTLSVTNIKHWKMVQLINVKF